MRIGILTGGGDVPGLNPCIKAAVYRATDEGHEMLGIRRGWGGLLNLNPDDPATQPEHVVPCASCSRRRALAGRSATIRGSPIASRHSPSRTR